MTVPTPETIAEVERLLPCSCAFSGLLGHSGGCDVHLRPTVAQALQVYKDRVSDLEAENARLREVQLYASVLMLPALQSFDSGGESMRSRRSQSLETAFATLDCNLWPGWHELKQRIDAEAFDVISEARRKFDALAQQETKKP